MTYTPQRLRVESFLRRIKDAEGAFWMASQANPNEVYRIGPIRNTMVTGVPVTPCDINYQALGEAVLMTPQVLLRDYKEIPSPSELRDYMAATRKLLAAQIREARALSGRDARPRKIDGMICPSGFRPADKEDAEPILTINLKEAIADHSVVRVTVGTRIRTHAITRGLRADDSPTQYERLGVELCQVMDELAKSSQIDGDCRFSVVQDSDVKTRLHFFQVGKIRSLVIPRVAVDGMGIAH